MRANRTLGCIGVPFFLLGATFVVLGIYFFIDNRRFQATALPAEGEVVRMESHESRDNKGRITRTQVPVVRFQAEGRTVEIRGHNTGSYHVGEKVPVRYQAGQLEDGRIDTASESFLLPGVFTGVGSLFACIGLAMLLVPALNRRRRSRILNDGTPVQAKVIEVRHDTSTKINGQSPWVLVAEFKDEISGNDFAATSQWIWVNPEPHYPVGSEVTVYYMPDNPRKNTFKLDKLPELA